MLELYNFTATQVLNWSVERVLEEHPELSKNLALKLVKNALAYNVVIEAICNEVDYLMEVREEI